MSPSALALLVSALCAAGSGVGGDDLAAATITIPMEFVEEAMRPAPVTVVLQTSYYGTVTVDHQAHLRRKAHCTDCHGPGPVAPIAFTPKVAHDRCRGCHETVKKGPTDCKGCHVMVPEEPAILAPGPAPAGGSSPAAAQTPSQEPGTAGVAAAGVTGGAAAASPGPAGVVVLSDEEREARSLHRTIQMGLAAGNGYGLSGRLASRQGGMLLSFGLDRLGGNGPTRTLVLVGAGSSLPVKLPPTLGLFAEGVAGLDAVSHPPVDLMVALGGRLGLEWTPRWALQVPFFLSVTGLLDAFHNGHLLSPACLFAAIGVGAPLERR